MEARKEREKEERKAEQERKRKRHKRRLIMGTIGAVIVLGVAAFGFIYQTQINSFSYQMDQAETAYGQGITKALCPMSAGPRNWSRETPRLRSWKQGSM